MSADTADMLRTGFAQIARGVDAPAGLATRAYDRWRRRQRIRRRAFGAGASITAAALMVTVLPGSMRPERHSPPLVVTAADMVRHISDALRAVAAGSLIEYARTELPPGTGPVGAPQFPGGSQNPSYTRPVSVLLYYQGKTDFTFYARPATKVFDTSTIIAHGQFTTTWVTYASRTWWREVAPFTGQVGSIWCSNSTQLDPSIGAWNPGGWTPVARSLLTCRYVQVDNHPGTIAGQHVVKLSEQANKLNGHTSWALWVSTRTYLPVALNVSYQRRPAWRTTFRWLPPSRPNLAAFEITIPRHSRRVPVPVG